ncbi:MAG: GH3 auxin-responsive promoter family protein [Geobacteraceae bacterium]|nr:GH3 auxin-responsive promoter family protein [Geobacteraceae bacterium]
MRRALCHAANWLWYLSTLREAAAFHRSLACVAAIQEQLLLEMLRRNRGTEFGRRCGFAAISSAREYQEAVPLAEYGDFEPYIARIGAGEPNLLTAEPVLLLEPTGGSSGGSKLIPYTAGLKRQFQRGIAPWIADLYRNFPGLLGGESYWSVSPAARQGERTGGGVPVGFEDDSDYAGGVGRLLVRSLQAVPEGVKRIGAMEGFWYATLLFLLRSRHLTLISVWNPTFLTILCGHLERWWPQLTDDIAAGTLTPPLPLDPALARQLGQYNRPDPERAREIRAVCSRGGDQAARHRELWPRLRLISSWCDGAAGEQAEELRRLFPQAELQGKGLLATEGFVTFPLAGVDGCLPALRSHFLEFLPRDGGEALLLHQLEAGRSYALVITTAGGLYRYRLHDLVRVTGFRNGVPLFRFVGKEEHISDRFGEKLHEGHVHGVLRRAAARSGLSPRFAMLAFEERPRSAYVFFVEEPGADDNRLARLGTEIDELLRENFHYHYCRDLGQLAPVRVFRIARDGREDYLRACCSHGQRLGDVKPLALHRRSGWSEVFRGRMLS